MDERPTEFTANFVVVSEYGGNYKVTEVFGLQENEESFSLLSEDQNFTFIAADFWSKLSCDEFEDENFEYCLDGTRKRKCSYTEPYRCIDNAIDDLALEYQPGFCGKPDWLLYSEECAYGEISYCDSQTNYVMRKTCEDNQWVTVFVEDCEDSKCLFNATYAYCAGPSSNTCTDGTIKGGCSNNKPYYCNDKAVLIKSPKICGCPAYADYDPITLSCVYNKCVDGTDVGNCSGAFYCGQDGELVEKASVCGCSEGYLVQNDTCVKEPENETVVPPPPPVVNDTVNESNETVPEPVTVESSKTVDKEDVDSIPVEWALAGIFLVIVLFTAYIFFKH